MNVSIVLGCCLLIADAPAEPVRQLESQSPAAHYRYRKPPHPDGTGKIYHGREIARVMSFHGASWLDRPEREEEERLSTLISLLELKAGDIVADIGAGSGTLTSLLAKAVGPTGKVFAVEIQVEMLALIRNRMRQEELAQVEPVLGTITSPQLPPESVDLALLVDVYHEFSHPREMITALSASLKPGGRLVLVEYRGEDPRVPIKALHKMTVTQVRKELKHPSFGLTWERTLDGLPRQHVLIFRKEPRPEKPQLPGDSGR